MEFHAPDGTRLYYSDDGDGPPLLCLAGLTRSGTDFDYVAPHLHGRRVIRLDYRGRGRSDWADPATYTIPTEAMDALALLDHLGIAAAPILGTSRGGLIGMTIAATAKDRLTGLCLVDVGPVLETAGLDTIRDYIGKNPSQKTHAEAAAARGDLIPGFDDVPTSRWLEEVQRHFIETEDGLQITYDPRLAEALPPDPAALPDIWPLYDALDGLPVAVIRGANSELLSAATVDEMAARRPDLVTATVPGRGHVPFLDEPESLEAIRAWLGRLA